MFQKVILLMVNNQPTAQTMCLKNVSLNVAFVKYETNYEETTAPEVWTKLRLLKVAQHELHKL